jgi:DNA-binding beta-propeller fold protein YncE
VCKGASGPYAQYGLALGFGSAWLACTKQSRVQRVSLATGKVEAAISLPAAVWSIAAGEGAVWAVALGGSTVYRIDPAANRLVARIDVGTSAPYLWTGGGRVWVADDPGRALLPIDPVGNVAEARVPVGDGPAGFAFDGTYAWVLNHREGSLDRIDPSTHAVVRMANGLGPANSAPERIALFGGSLWVTGRGLDLLRLSPTTGSVLGTTEIGPAGVDVRSDGTSLWVAAYDAAAESRGDPVVGAVLRIAADGSIIGRTVPSKRLFADGMGAASGQLWLFDAVAGLLVRLPA